MKLRLGILLLFGILSVAFIPAQNEINYKHKALIKTLQKAGVKNLAAIEEIALPDSVNTANLIQGKYFLINENNANEYRYIYVGRVNSCRADGCSITTSLPADGNSEYFDYYILFDAKKTVQAVKVFNYQATHGQEITAKGWLKQFIGHNGSEPLQVDKNIDTISGATISVYAITFDVEMKTEILKEI
ncbi:FMN-binding protein [Prolixibacteraceae bacterium Z1-6]|uniref:FMN-binding protein n=1 Tax=Draconibacterium aestuarii TaxID=2998507 RepID=A0A9X3J693_9BACT|nr:FMN-binding protein [Prolixibacteraceae bacterium Z1-6]